MEKAIKSRQNAQRVAEYIIGELIQDPKYARMLEGLRVKYSENDSDFLMALGGYMGFFAKEALNTRNVRYSVNCGNDHN